jgi:hypothetical protein
MKVLNISILFVFFILISKLVLGQDLKIICPSEWQGEENKTIFSTGINYYGIYSQKYVFKSKVKIFIGKDTLVDNPAIGSYRIVLDNETPMPEFIVSGLEIRDTLIPGRHFGNEMLYPGETVGLYLDHKSYLLFVKGNIIESKDGEVPFSEIQNYRLILQESSLDILTNLTFKREQLLFEMNLKAWLAEGFVGGFYLKWIGDINGDGKLDILMKVSDHYACYDIVFLMSNKLSDKLIEEVFRYTLCDC